MSPPSHRELLQYIDDRMHELFINAAQNHDKARINSFKITGASSWLNMPCNDYYGIDYTNLQYHIMQSLCNGHPILTDDATCNRCKKQMDECGCHALHCSYA